MRRHVSVTVGGALLASCMVLAMTSCAPKSAKVLKVGMECAYAPFNWTQTTDANGATKIADSATYAYGYDVMVAQKVAAKLGYELSVVKTEWDGLIPSVQSGKIDAIIAGMCKTPERAQAVDFSDTYYNASIVVLTMANGKYANAKSVSDLAGATMTSQLNTVWYTLLQQVPNAKILPGMDTVPSLLVALTSGKVEAYTTDLPTAMAVVHANPSVKLIDFKGGEGFKVETSDVEMGIAVKKGNAKLLKTINEVLASLSEEDRQKLMQDAIEKQPLAQ